MNQRPISVSNTDNRIISNCLRLVLIGPIGDLIAKSQGAFFPGRTIESPIRSMNQKFYNALKENEELYILLVDFAKAFDSVSIDYLLELLTHIGTPLWVNNLVSSLYSNIRAQPILFDKHNIIIAILDGLKQGCPLAPLFFVLVIDPLLLALSRVRGLSPEAFADDLAIALKDPNRLRCIITAIDLFSAASGVRTNIGKTLLLTTVDDSTPALALLPLGKVWAPLSLSAIWVLTLAVMLM